MIKIVGILNVNNDSFYDGGKYIVASKALIRAKQMIKEGADIIEVGGFSTKPGSKVPSVSEELRRIKPILLLLSKLNHPISVETSRSEIVKEIKQIPNIKYINDTSGLSDEKIIHEIKSTDITYILMHMRCTYENMNTNTKYNDGVFDEMYAFLEEKINIIENIGLKRIIIDPGFFFDKTCIQNLNIINNLGILKKLNYPIFIALSRKSHLLKMENIGNNLALIETCILNFICMQKGAEYIRVHDVKEAKFTVELLKLYYNSK